MNDVINYTDILIAKRLIHDIELLEPDFNILIILSKLKDCLDKLI